MWSKYVIYPSSTMLFLALIGVEKTHRQVDLGSRTCSWVLFKTTCWPSIGLSTSKGWFVNGHCSTPCNWYLWEAAPKACSNGLQIWLDTWCWKPFQKSKVWLLLGSTPDMANYDSHIRKSWASWTSFFGSTPHWKVQRSLTWTQRKFL